MVLTIGRTSAVPDRNRPVGRNTQVAYPATSIVAEQKRLFSFITLLYKLNTVLLKLRQSVAWTDCNVKIVKTVFLVILQVITIITLLKLRH